MGKGQVTAKMEGVSLRSRALTFALCAGAVAFILALLAGADVATEPDGVARALIVALVCGVMSWGSAERAVAGIATAVDHVSERLAAAAEGDLVSAPHPCVEEALPTIATAMNGMFGRMRENLDAMNALALFDPLTTLPNRTNFRCAAEAQLAALPGSGIAALVFVDLDRFKSVNDTLGHAVGDEMLRMVADRLRTAAEAERARLGLPREALIVARLAGDEFILFATGLRDREEGRAIAEALLGALEAPFAVDGQKLDVGASIGVALCPDHGRELTLLLRAADVAMYHAKAIGRGQLEVFSPALAARERDRQTMEDEIRLAIDRSEFELVFQPQIDLNNGGLVAAEALLRWRHPTDGVRVPGQFFQVAEQTGLIGPLSDWAVEAAVAALGRWYAAGMGQRLALNIGARQIEDPAFGDRLRRALARAGAPAHMLEIEVNETIATAIGYGGPLLDTIGQLRREGVTVAVDDFGSGYSNLGRLRHLPVDRIKLDPVLVREVSTSSASQAVTGAVIAMAHGLGLSVVAEGVEKPEQREVLRVIGCEAGQGLLLAAPMAERDLIRAYRAGRRVAAG